MPRRAVEVSRSHAVSQSKTALLNRDTSFSRLPGAPTAALRNHLATSHPKITLQGRLPRLAA